jgi:hypothetical protein
MFDRTLRKILCANTPTAQRNPEIPFSSPFDKRGKEGDLKNLGAPFNAGREKFFAPVTCFSDSVRLYSTTDFKYVWLELNKGECKHGKIYPS